MPHKTWASLFLHHSCIIWVVTIIENLYIYETFKAAFDEIIRNIQAEARAVKYEKSVCTEGEERFRFILDEYKAQCSSKSRLSVYFNSFGLSFIMLI